MTADPDSRFTLQAALGLSWSQSLFVGQYNLVVDAVSDFWYLSAMSVLLREGGLESLDEQLVITPVGGATKAAYVGTIMHAQKRHVAVLLDSSKEGKSAYEQLVHHWIVEARNVLMLSEVMGVAEQRTLEDLFDENYYMSHVNAAYLKELGGKPMSLPPGKRGIVERIEGAMKAKGIEKFNRARVSKRIIEELPRKKFADISKETIKNFQMVISAINKCVVAWKKA